jgi:uncharacterized protein YggT (Ycf19 family)
MLVGILNFIFNLILFLLSVISWVLLIYVFMALLIPQNKYTVMVGKYVEPVLSPIRKLLFRWFPKLAQVGIDFSPLALYLLIQIASWLIRLLRSILL